MQAINLRQSLFWDTDVSKLDTQKNATYIIERIMDFGNDDEVRWMRKYYPKELIASICKSSKELHKSSRNLWTKLASL